MGDSKRGLFLVGLLVLFFLFVIYTNNSGFLETTGSAIESNVYDNSVNSLATNKGGENIKNFVFILLAGALVFTLLMKGEKTGEESSASAYSYMSNVDSLFREAMDAHSMNDYQRMEKAMAKINSIYQNLEEDDKEEVYEKVLVFYDSIMK